MASQHDGGRGGDVFKVRLQPGQLGWIDDPDVFQGIGCDVEWIEKNDVVAPDVE